MTKTVENPHGYYRRQPNGYSLPNGLDLSRIAPQAGFRFSPNLHAFLAKHTSLAWLARVFHDKSGLAYLGFIDDTGQLIGARLNQVLSMGVKTTLCSYYGEWTERVAFWDEYVADGRCAIDREHVVSYVGSETRWRTHGDCRSCIWCNKMTQKLRRWTETKVIEHEAWEPLAELPATAQP
jgi:hypothetical protein